MWTTVLCYFHKTTGIELLNGHFSIYHLSVCPAAAQVGNKVASSIERSKENGSVLRSGTNALWAACKWIAHVQVRIGIKLVMLQLPDVACIEHLHFSFGLEPFLLVWPFILNKAMESGSSFYNNNPRFERSFLTAK